MVNLRKYFNNLKLLFYKYYNTLFYNLVKLYSMYFVYLLYLYRNNYCNITQITISQMDCLNGAVVNWT